MSICARNSAQAVKYCLSIRIWILLSDFLQIFLQMVHKYVCRWYTNIFADGIQIFLQMVHKYFCRWYTNIFADGTQIILRHIRSFNVNLCWHPGTGCDVLAVNTFVRFYLNSRPAPAAVPHTQPRLELTHAFHEHFKRLEQVCIIYIAFHTDSDINLNVLKSCTKCLSRHTA